MLAGAGLLLLLDGTILSPTPNLTRVVFALVVTLVVGGFIIAVWRSNSRQERAAANLEKRPSAPKPGGVRSL